MTCYLNNFYVQKVYIVERNICSFDLTSPIGAFHFASFCIRLQEHTETLKDLFNQKRVKIFEKAERGELPKWTKEVQVKEMDPQVMQKTIAVDVPTSS